MAEELGERVGERVGYRVRFEDAVSARTRVVFVTEGVLTRRLLSDPELKGVGAVLLDEFHERHLHGDVALALLRRLQERRRGAEAGGDVGDARRRARSPSFLGCPSLRAEGRRFDVTIEYARAPPTATSGRSSSDVAAAVRKLVADGLDGDVLVFLPGAAEIRKAQAACAASRRRRGSTSSCCTAISRPKSRIAPSRRARGAR